MGILLNARSRPPALAVLVALMFVVLLAANWRPLSPPQRRLEGEISPKDPREDDTPGGRNLKAATTSPSAAGKAGGDIKSQPSCPPTADSRQVSACSTLERIMSDVQVAKETICSDRSHNPITLVTGYYNMRSKHSAQNYLSWIELFLLRVQTPMIVYTNCDTAQELPEFGVTLRKRHSLFPAKSLVQFMELEKTDLARQLSAVFKQQEGQDPEQRVGHNYWLYLAWLLKSESLLEAVRLDPFCSEWFMWSDIGALRHGSHKYSHWPSLERLQLVPKDRVLMSLVYPFSGGGESKAADATNDTSVWLGPKRHGLIDSDHLAGTFIAFSMARNVQYDFYHALRTTYRRLREAGHLVVKDQTVYNAMYLLNRELFALVPSHGGGGDDSWRYLQHWLAEPAERPNAQPLAPLLLPL